MRVLVVGAGAVGSLLGGLLAVAGHEVTLLGRDDQPRSRGRLVLHAPDGHARPVDVWRAGGRRPIVEADDGPPEVIVFAVRQVDLSAALGLVDGWPAAPSLTVQNGIGAEELALARRPRAPLVAASLTAPVQVPESGEIRWLSRGGLGLAPVTGGPEAATLVGRLRDDFSAAGMRTAALRDARSMKWSKLLANLVGNASSALLDLDPQQVYADRGLFALEQGQLREAVLVMRRQGLRPVRLPGADARLLALAALLPAQLVRPVMVRIVGGARGGKMPSLRLHLRSAAGAAAPSEVAWLNGAVASAGTRFGVPTPINAALAGLVEAATSDPSFRQALRGRPSALLEAVRSWGAADWSRMG